jgi:hypothetical protein
MAKSPAVAHLWDWVVNVIKYN